MKKQYFAWKNGKQNAKGTQDWVELTSKEFLEICKSNIGKPIKERRLFARIPNVDDGDTYYLLECDYTNYLKSVSAAMERLRKRIEKEQLKNQGLWYDIISLDFGMTDEEGESYTLHDILADPDSIFEDRLITSMDLQRALSVLSDDERSIIECLYLSAKPKTLREYAAEINVPFTTLQNKKTKILKKMKKSFVQN